jgi:hypothetical protein
VSDDPRIAAAAAELRRRVAEPLVLTTVMRGQDRLGTWELRDGPHSMPQDPDAVAHELITHRPGIGGGSSSGIGPRLAAGEIGRIGTEASDGRHYQIGYLTVCCADSVTAIRVHYDDDTISDVSTALSQATGERWAVCPLDSTGHATRIEFLDESEAVLDVQTVRDPRTPKGN